MVRKIVTALVLVPLAIAFITFAVANRQIVVISLDPFDQAHPAIAMSLPLFALILVLIIGGVVVGGVADWLKQRGSMSGPASSGMPSDYAPQLTIPPPAG